MANKRYNVPKYMKNVGKSAKKISFDVVKTTMPQLSNTAISMKDVYNDIRVSMTKERAKIKTQQKYQNNTLLRPVKEIIENAKADLKSGNFYNTERLENKSATMSEFLGMGDDNWEDYDYDSPKQGTIESSTYNKIIASSSMHSMNLAKSIGDMQLKSAEYLGSMYQTNHMQDLILHQKHHLEHMKKLDNVEKLTSTLVEFNLNTMTEHIRTTHQFYEKMLDDTAELKNELHRISTNLTDRYGSNTKKRKTSALETIFSNGFDMSAYGKYVKKNIKNQIPLTPDMAKMLFSDFKDSPISSIIKLAMSFGMSGANRSGSKLDKAFTGIFGDTLRKVSGWKKGIGVKDGPLGMLQQLAGTIFGVDFGASTKPDLSIYKNQAMTAELEQKKTKAITEVIPQYLSAITKEITGKNMYYNYDKGVFEDRSKTRKDIEQQRKNELVYTMDDTKRYFDSKSKSVVGKFIQGKTNQNIVYEDIDTFIAWLATSSERYNPQNHKNDDKYYYELEKKGLNLRGGLQSYKIIEMLYMKATPAQRKAIQGERVSANISAKEFEERWNERLQSSGQSALFNDFDRYSSPSKKRIKSNISSSDMYRFIMNMTDLSPEELAAFNAEYERDRKRSLGIKDENSKNDVFTNAKKGIFKKLGIDKLTSKAKDISKYGTGLIDSITDRVSDLSEGRIEYAETDTDFFNTGSGNKPKKSRNANKQNIPKRKSNFSSNSIISSIIDYRPYFETIDSHLRNIATITERTIPVSVVWGQSGAPVLVQDVGGVFKESTSPDGINIPGESIINKGRESIAKAYRSAMDKLPEAAKTVKDRFVGIKNKIKEKGSKFVGSVWDGIKEHDGNIQEYFQSEDWQNKISGIKGGISTAGNFAKNLLGSAKDGAKSAFNSTGTLFGDLKQKASSGLKKGKNIALGSMITTAMGLGPIPGAIIGTLFSKKDKNKSDKEGEEAVKSLENEKSKETKTGISKGKKAANLIKGAAFSSLLGLGPIPGIITASIINKFKKKNDKEDKDAVDAIDGEEKKIKKKKGIGKGKKAANLVKGAAASTLLGLGPIPGVIAASIINKFKDRKANEDKEGDEAVESMENAQNDKNKDGFLSKVKRFFGKGKNIALGAAASSLLGLGPMPGIIAGAIYNKKKYKKKANDKIEGENTTSTIDEVADNELSKTSQSPSARISSNKKKYNIKKSRKNISDIVKLRKAEMAGKANEANRYEDRLLNKAAANGDINSLESTTNIVSNMRDSSDIGSGAGAIAEEKKERKSLFDMLGNSGVLSSLLKIAPWIAGLLSLWQNTKDGDNIADSAAGIGGTLIGTKIAGALSKLPVVGKYIGKWSGGSAIGYGVRGITNIAQGDYDDATSDFAKGGASLYKGATIFKGKNAIKAVKSIPKIPAAIKTATHAVKISKAGTTISIKIAQILKWLANNDTVQRIAGKKIVTALSKHSTSIGKHVAAEIAERTAKTAAKAGANAGAKAGTGAAHAIPVAGWILAGIQLVWGFISGWNDVRNTLKLPKSYNPPTGLKVTSAIVKALDDATLGLLDLFSIRDNVIEFIYKLFASDANKADLEAAKEQQKNDYNSFMENNQGSSLTFDKYNELTNRTLFGKAWDATKKFFGGKVETLDDYKTGIRMTNYDNSNTVNVVAHGGSGGGFGYGRGPSSFYSKSGKGVLSNVEKIIHNAKNLPGNSIRTMTDDQLNQAVKDNNDSYTVNNKNKNIFSSAFEKVKGVASTVLSGAKNAWDTVKSGASSVWNWFKGLFGSGGRGENINGYTYYNQKDPAWANQYFGKYFGKRDTVKEGGCGPTVAAMALEHLTGQKINPSVMADLALVSGNKVDDGGTDPSFFNTAGNMYGVNFNQTKGLSNSALASLKNGTPVPLLGNSGPYGKGSHYLLATKLNGNKISVLDPQNKNNNKNYSISDLQNATNMSMVVSGAGRVCNNCKSIKNTKYINKVKKLGRGPFGEDYSDGTEKQTGRYSTKSIPSLYKNGTRKASDIKYIVIHYTGSKAYSNSSDQNALSAANWFANSANPYKTSAHYCVGSSVIYQCLNDTDIGAHCGGSLEGSYYPVNGICTNSNSIGIEVGEEYSSRKSSSAYFPESTVSNLISLVNSLMNKYNIDKDHVVRHQDCTGKSCPVPGWLHTSNSESQEWLAFKNKLSGRGGSSKASWISIVKSTKQALSSASGGKYSQSKFVNITVGGKTISARTDCSGFVAACLKFYGVLGDNENITSSNTNNMKDSTMSKTGFSAMKWPGWDSLQEGDIISNSGHAEIFSRNSGSTHYVYNAGSDRALSQPGETSSSYSEYTTIWRPGSAGTNCVFGATEGSATYRNIYEQLLGGIVEAENSPLAQLRSGINNILGITDGSSNTSNGGSYSSTNGSGKTVTQSEAWKRNVTSYSKSSITSESLKNALDTVGGKNRGITKYVDDIIKYSNKYGIDPRFVATMAIHESGWDTNSGKFKEHNNPFGWNITNNGDYSANYSSFGDALDKILPKYRSEYIDKGQNSLYGFVHPAEVGAESWHNYTPGSSFEDRAKTYMGLINATGGAGGRGFDSNPTVQKEIANQRKNFVSYINNKNKIIPKISIPKSNSSEIRKELKKSSNNNLLKETLKVAARGTQDNINSSSSDILSVLQGIFSLLTEIKDSNNIIANKNFSPQIALANTSGGVNMGTMLNGHQKSNIIDNIISGI